MKTSVDFDVPLQKLIVWFVKPLNILDNNSGQLGTATASAITGVLK